MSNREGKPNILFVTTDQQRKDTLGCYGNNLIKTPNLDKLAADGVVFDRAYCESPICIPSRNTMITGKCARHHGASLHNTSIRDEETTLGDTLQKNGYRTYFTGKPHFKSQQHRGTEESIADWRDGKLTGWKGPYAGFEKVDMVLGHSNPLVGHYGEWLRENHPEAAKTYMDKNLESIGVACGQGVYNNHIPEETYSSSYVAARTCDFLDEAKRNGSPFYCFASFPDPHWPILPPREFFEMYDGVEIPENIPIGEDILKENYPRQFAELLKGKVAAYDGGGRYLRDDEDITAITRAYWGAISLIDKNIGKMLDKLESLGLSDDTIVIFTTDHGEYMGAHGMIAKGGFLWESFVNVPYIMRYPKARGGGGGTDALISFTDIVPTLLDYAGITEHDMAPDGFSQR
ncbi:MAG: sulfatase-like hydrolase/transferase, partial [Kiritimatiellaeota bacterium]|nr:sulfatase-like hydrolase/transferase [Kiritimatiellota bacterium]